MSIACATSIGSVIPAKQPWLPPSVRPAETAIVFPTVEGQTVVEPGSLSVIECLNSSRRRHDYSIGSDENADGTLLNLHDPVTFQCTIVDSETFAIVRDKGFDLGAYRRWSAVDSDSLYTCGVTSGPGAQNILFSYHPSTDIFETIFDFNTLGYTAAAGWLISIGQGDGDIDSFGLFAPITVANIGTGEYWMYVIDIQNKSVHGDVLWSTLSTRQAVNIPASLIGTTIPSYFNMEASFTMTRDGQQVVVIRGGDGSDEWPSMLEVYNNDFTNRREVGALRSNGTTWATMHVSHIVTAVDMDGNQVIVSEQHPDTGNFFIISTGEFVHFPHAGFGHLGYSKGLSGYATHYAYDSSTADTRAIVLVPLRKDTGSAVFEANTHGLPIFSGAPSSECLQYCYHRSTGTIYEEQPQASPTHIGDAVYFASNQPGAGNAFGYRVRQQ